MNAHSATQAAGGTLSCWMLHHSLSAMISCQSSVQRKMSKNDSKIFQVWLRMTGQRACFFAKIDAHVGGPAEPFANIGKGRGRNCGRSPGGSSLEMALYKLMWTPAQADGKAQIHLLHLNRDKKQNSQNDFLDLYRTEHVHEGLKLSEADRSIYRTKPNSKYGCYSVVMANLNLCDAVNRHGLGDVMTCACLINEPNIPGKNTAVKTCQNCLKLCLLKFTVSRLMNLVRGDLGDGCGRIDLGSLRRWAWSSMEQFPLV